MNGARQYGEAINIDGMLYSHPGIRLSVMSGAEFHFVGDPDHRYVVKWTTTGDRNGRALLEIEPPVPRERSPADNEMLVFINPAARAA